MSDDEREIIKQEEPTVPRDREKPGKAATEKDECKTKRLAIIIGKGKDDAIKAARKWVIARAKVLGGSFHMWTDTSSGTPLDTFRAHDITGGKKPNYKKDPEFNVAKPHKENGKRVTLEEELSEVMKGCQGCRGRIEELVIIHHGENVKEGRLAKTIAKIFLALRIPVCRVVWWSCNASVSLDMREGGATDEMMRILGSSSIGQCDPCGCKQPITLIWPTAGKCNLSGPKEDDALRSGDGKVHKAKWGYRDKDGNLKPRPPKGDGMKLRRPPNRTPKYPDNKDDKKKEKKDSSGFPKVEADVLGKKVGVMP